MREILFKAKSISNGEWVEGAYLHQTDYYGEKCDKHYIIDGTETDMEGYGEHYLIDKDTLCQYTGLTDKNGNKIWENDVVWDSEERELYKIIWCQDSMRYCVENGDGFDCEFDSDYASSLETNSNIFDNPELIGGGE